MGRTTWGATPLIALVVSALATSVQAQNQPPSAAPLDPAPAPARHVLPPVPQLRLRWPIAPLAFSFSAEEVTGYANGPLQLFRAESLWVDAPGLQLLTSASAARAFELDCRLTCQPVVNHALALEARVPMPSIGPSLPNNYAFVRSSSFYTSQATRFTRQIGAGFAGALNF